MVGNLLASIMCGRLSLPFSNEKCSQFFNDYYIRPFELYVLDINLVIFLSLTFYLFLISRGSEC